MSAPCADAWAILMGSWTPFVTGGFAGRAPLPRAPTSSPATRMPRPASCASDTRWAAAPTTRWAAAGRRAPEALLYEPRHGRLSLRLAGALRLAIRPASLPRRAELSFRRQRRRGEGRPPVRRPRPRHLGTPRPDHLHHAGLSADPLAVRGGQQPAGHWPVARDLVRLRLSRRTPLAGRRTLLQSRAAPGLRHRRYDGRRRLSPGRGAEVQLSLPALQHLATLRAPGDDWAARATVEGGWASCQEKDLSPDLPGRQVLGTMFDTNRYVPGSTSSTGQSGRPAPSTIPPIASASPTASLPS